MPRGPPWIAALPLVPRFGDATRGEQRVAEVPVVRVVLGIALDRAGRSASIASSKRPTLHQHDAGLLCAAALPPVSASARCTVSIASSRSPSRRWLLPSTVQTSVSVSQPSSMQRRSDASALCRRPRWCSDLAEHGVVRAEFRLEHHRASHRGGGLVVALEVFAAPGRGCATPATRAARSSTSSRSMSPADSGRWPRAQDVGVVVVEADVSADGAPTVFSCASNSSIASSTSLRSESSAPRSCTAWRFVGIATRARCGTSASARGEIAGALGLGARRDQQLEGTAACGRRRRRVRRSLLLRLALRARTRPPFDPEFPSHRQSAETRAHSTRSYHRGCDRSDAGVQDWPGRRSAARGEAPRTGRDPEFAVTSKRALPRWEAGMRGGGRTRRGRARARLRGGPAAPRPVRAAPGAHRPWSGSRGSATGGAWNGSIPTGSASSSAAAAAVEAGFERGQRVVPGHGLGRPITRARSGPLATMPAASRHASRSGTSSFAARCDPAASLSTLAATSSLRTRRVDVAQRRGRGPLLRRRASRAARTRSPARATRHSCAVGDVVALDRRRGAFEVEHHAVVQATIMTPGRHRVDADAVVRRTCERSAVLFMGSPFPRDRSLRRSSLGHR